MVESSEMTTNPSEALNKQKSTTKTKERPKQQWTTKMHTIGKLFSQKNNQKRLNAKHNRHLQVYAGHNLSKTGTICFWPITWLVGCVFTWFQAVPVSDSKRIGDDESSRGWDCTFLDQTLLTRWVPQVRNYLIVWNFSGILVLGLAHIIRRNVGRVPWTNFFEVMFRVRY